MTKNWEAYWDSRPQSSDGSLNEALIQVGKTQFGQPVPAAQIESLVAHIQDSLKMQDHMSALDLGCGNGLITYQLAQGLRRVAAFDYSSALLETARTHFAAPHITYTRADLKTPEDISLEPVAFDVAWSVEVIQNLDEKDLTGLLKWLAAALTKEGLFLASGIPDQARIRSFYNTKERWDLHLKNAAEGREQMGKWWTREEISDCATAAGLKVEFLPLPARFYTAAYRFDALFSKHGS